MSNICGNCESFASDICFIQNVPVQFETRACAAFEPEEISDNYTAYQGGILNLLESEDG